MPGFDGTGPRGMGSMTGGGRGYCALPGDRGATGRFFGRGAGRGYRNRYLATGVAGRQRSVYAPVSADEERELLKAEAEELRAELESIQSHILKLEKNKADLGGE